ncbi:hypothetical protein ASPZODRAFT_61974 [Penicilliopsis zonata CBS 506.65]|uniref:Uncharacterized protein n=1 Tax=Penicilliopsis zonata CBS 506.65 TaxID=1073090 RepID=A0A1L9SM85_9EURO|nr:hypothetical protein ASPZODRAFT_61974 [Penicilliopsis zonata CBS 506.65]OJJ48211.1 hypothetical protein ASPZODRAFT_61974 [Penicilliopsis zonata CBS 506.65]
MASGTQPLTHFLRVAVAFALLPIDTFILVVSYTLSHLTTLEQHPTDQRDTQVYSKTVLVTGIDTPQGLAVSRACHRQGHRVVGVDVDDRDTVYNPLLCVRSGGSLSCSVAAFYRIPRTLYVSSLLDIVHREKADLWIPCSERVTVLEDAVAKQVLESRTTCKAVHLDAELTDRLANAESLAQFLVDKDLPVVERHRVQSRDSIHKILHRSPTKAYRIRKLAPVLESSSSTSSNRRDILLPKRTLSQTYSEVSEIQISKDAPWVLQQQTRLGEFWADTLLVRGHVEAIKVRPGRKTTEDMSWGASRLDESLASAIYRVVEAFASKGGTRMTGHLSLQLMVDEEFEANSVRHSVHIAGCTQGAGAVTSLLRDPSCALAGGYLALLQLKEKSSVRSEERAGPARIISLTPRAAQQGLLARTRVTLSQRVPGASGLFTLGDALADETTLFLFWEHPLFLAGDPMPWWWDVHVSRPAQEVWNMCRRSVK